MAWWSRTGGLESELKKSVPKGIWIKCEKCAATLYESDLIANLRVCTSCGHHLRMATDERIGMMLDGEWIEHDTALESSDPLGFRVDGKKYADQIKAATKKNGPGDAYRAGTATIGGIPVEAGFFVFEFMGGSMGSVVGEKITRQFERAYEHRRPAILFSASGGARMQEGVLSLMQMAKTSAARSRLREARVPYIAVLLHPTTGGVAASVAMLGDIILAEPDALIGFAGPRVIEQTIRQQLPPGFQRSEFLLEHGMVDQVVPRTELKASLVRALRWFTYAPGPDVGDTIDDDERLDRGGRDADGYEAHDLVPPLGTPANGAGSQGAASQGAASQGAASQGAASQGAATNGAAARAAAADRDDD